MKIKKIVLVILGLFCYQHLVRDYLQDKGVKNWYTTFDHWKFIPDTPRNNYIGMVIFFVVGSILFCLALRKKKYAA